MKAPKVYKSGKNFYYKLTIEGVRTNFKAPGRSRQEAQQYVNRLYGAKTVEDAVTFGDVLHLFTDPETNPKIKDAVITGHQYTMRYARRLASYAERLELFLQKHAAGFFASPVKNISRKECKELMYTMVDKLGVSYLAMKYWKVVKMAMSYATDESLLPANPAQRLPDIKPKKVREILPVETGDMARILNGDYFADDYEKDLVTLLACTGMRIGELAALTPRQYQDGVLVIDRAYKDENFRETGLPKWGYTRTIPLCRMAREAIERRIRLADIQEIFGLHPEGFYNRVVKGVMARALQDKGWASPAALAKVSVHVFRHTLNTNLRITSTIGDSLIAEYLSWQHQPENSVQKGYTHFYASSLQCVADQIDEMYSKGECKILQFAGR